MVGSKSEHGGIIKDGAKMVNAMSNSIVPNLLLLLEIHTELVITLCVEKLTIQD